MNKAAPGKDANGENTPQPAAAAVAPKAARPRDARQARFAQSFAQIVAVLMRDPNFRNLRLADLEWLVLPPIMAGQFRLAQMPVPQAKGQKGGGDKPQEKTGAQDEGGVLVPVAVALWARVSPSVDKRLSEELDKPIDLKANEWVSGDILWLVVAAGDRRALPTFIKQLEEKEFKDKTVKMRTRDGAGGVVVKALGKTEEVVNP